MEIVPRFRIQTPHSSPRTSHGSKGFTLLEVLIAVAIMAGIVTVIYASFFTTSQNVEQAEKIRDASDLARTLVAKLTNDIANAYVNAGMNTSNAPLTIFYGKKVQPETGDDKPRYDELYLDDSDELAKTGDERDGPLGSRILFQAETGRPGICHDAQGKA